LSVRSANGEVAFARDALRGLAVRLRAGGEILIADALRRQLHV
jgi:hypothetical protein